MIFKGESMRKSLVQDVYLYGWANFERTSNRTEKYHFNGFDVN